LKRTIKEAEEKLQGEMNKFKNLSLKAGKILKRAKLSGRKVEKCQYQNHTE
jgi:hypothetical protein